MRSFKRYAGSGDNNDNGVRMPHDVLGGSSSKLTIGELVSRLEEYSNDASYAALYPWANRFAMGMPLPSFQRAPAWTREQKTRFISSLWAGIEPGSYLINSAFELVTVDGVKQTREFSECLLDGQQRLTAIEEYLLETFAVKDASGTPRLWTELPRVERRRFTSLTFVRTTIQTYDEEMLRLAYDLRAFGGTPHQAHERALPADGSLRIT